MFNYSPSNKSVSSKVNSKRSIAIERKRKHQFIVKAKLKRTKFTTLKSDNSKLFGKSLLNSTKIEKSRNDILNFPKPIFSQFFPPRFNLAHKQHSPRALISILRMLLTRHQKS